MPNYIANSPSMPSAPRPAIDVGGIINSISQAYQSNKQGVLQRALLQHQVAQQNAELQMHQQAQELQLRQAGWRPQDEVQPQPSPMPTPSTPGPISAALASPAPPPPVSDALQGAPTPAPRLAPVPAPVAPPMTPAPPAGPPSQSMQFNGKTYVLGTPPALQRQMDARRSALASANTAHPGLFTPEEIEVGAHDDRAFDQLFRRVDTATQTKAERADRLQSLQGATDAHGKPLSPVLIQGLANDPVAFRKYLDTAIAPPEDKLALHERERVFDQGHPLRDPAAHEDPKQKRADTYITSRIQKLTAPGPKDAAGQTTPGLDFESARRQAVQEAGRLYGGGAVADYTAEDNPSIPGGSGKPLAHPGPISLDSPQGPDPVKAAQPEFDATAAKYQRALKLGAPPEQARQAYSDDLTAIARKHGLAH